MTVTLDKLNDADLVATVAAGSEIDNRRAAAEAAAVELARRADAQALAAAQKELDRIVADLLHDDKEAAKVAGELDAARAALDAVRVRYYAVAARQSRQYARLDQLLAEYPGLDQARARTPFTMNMAQFITYSQERKHGPDPVELTSPAAIWAWRKWAVAHGWKGE